MTSPQRIVAAVVGMLHRIFRTLIFPGVWHTKEDRERLREAAEGEPPYK
ncbi:MAG: hypothetical protein ABR505_02715 [Actinomycetota bacterium]